MSETRRGKNYTDGLQLCERSKTEESTCYGCLLLRGKSLPRRRQRQHRTRQVLYGTRVYVALGYLDLLSVRVYTLIRWHVAGTSQGSCNLAERAAEGRQWSKLGEGGWWTCIQLPLKGLMTPNRKHHHTNTPNNITESRSPALRLASWLSLSKMTSSEVISLLSNVCLKGGEEESCGWGHKGGSSLSPFSALCSYISPCDLTSQSNIKSFLFVMSLQWFGCKENRSSAYFYDVNNSTVVLESNFVLLRMET